MKQNTFVSVFKLPFWVMENQYNLDNHTFCPLFTHREISNLLRKAQNPNISFTTEDLHTVLFILTLHSFGAGWRLANFEHFLRIATLREDTRVPIQLRTLLGIALEDEWRRFALDLSLD